jgi:ribosomal protein S18 acetylase RimI-like enzyme
MSLRMRPITTEEMTGWLAEHSRGYFESRVASGEPSGIAQANASESMARLFPGGMPAAGHDVFVLVETEEAAKSSPPRGTGEITAGEMRTAATLEVSRSSIPEDVDAAPVVGSLWIGPYPDDRADDVWVWSVALDEEHRGRGLGRAAMLLAEEEARRRGAAEIGLNVFGFNDVALGLYRSLGYETTSVQMRKILS